ncbi:MAG: L-type lectin domain-containing protein [Clostridia bacterium]|nr:L-type lectin domain-containing protein [Clostridia bacterium]
MNNGQKRFTKLASWYPAVKRKMFLLTVFFLLISLVYISSVFATTGSFGFLGLDGTFLENIKITNQENEETTASYLFNPHSSKMEFDLKKAVNELVLELDLPNIIKITSIENVFKDGIKIEHDAIVDGNKIVLEQTLEAGHYKLDFTLGIEGELVVKTKSCYNENKIDLPNDNESGAFTFKFVNLDSLPLNFLDFSNETKNNLLQYNGSAQIVDNVLQLTPRSADKTGSAFTKEKLSLGEERSFSTYFTFRISGAADGFCFILQESANTALGTGGSGLGIRDIPSPVVAVEFDIWGETEVHDSPHVGIDINPQGEGWLLALKSAAAIGTPWNIKNGEIYHVWIDYDGKNKYMDVRMNTNNNRATSNLLLHYPLDLTKIIGQDVYMGFTGATGMACASHEILSWLVAQANWATD